MISADSVIQEVLENKPDFVPEFLKTVLQIKTGGYGEGDTLLGVKIPTLKKIAQKYKDISLDELEKLIKSRYHEVRYLSLIILNKKFKKAPLDVLNMYLNNLKYVNNWDLVDISAYNIVGKYCIASGDNDVIYKLSESENLWKNRIAIVATYEFIKNENFFLTLELCEHFLDHEHHLIQKACGWMLREISKRSPEIVVDFIRTHQNISSIMKSYALEYLRKMSS